MKMRWLWCVLSVFSLTCSYSLSADAQDNMKILEEIIAHRKFNPAEPGKKYMLPNGSISSDWNLAENTLTGTGYQKTIKETMSGPMNGYENGKIFYLFVQGKLQAIGYEDLDEKFSERLYRFTNLEKLQLKEVNASRIFPGNKSYATFAIFGNSYMIFRSKGVMGHFFYIVLMEQLEQAKALNCCINLKAALLALRKYAIDNNEKFPKNLDELVSGNYCEKRELLCPSCKQKYSYVSGLNESDEAECPLIFCLKHNQPQVGYVSGASMPCTDRKTLEEKIKKYAPNAAVQWGN